MRSAFLLLMITAMVAACATTEPPLPPEKAALIPDGSNRLILQSDWEVDTLFARVKRHLEYNEFYIDEEDQLTKRVVTSAKEIGQRTQMSITLRMSPIIDGSQMEALAQWHSDLEEADMATVGRDISGQTTNWRIAAWDKTFRDSRTYAHLLLLFEQIEHRSIEHLTK